MSDFIIHQPQNVSQDAPTILFVMGPTAAGKTDLALACAEQFGCELISVDSALIYREMDIGTAKPDAQTLQQVPHALVDIIDPGEAYSVASFREDALAESRAIISRGKTPLLVGGTMLYYRALQQGLSVLPAADASVRSQLEAEAQASGWAAMHRRLARVDPQAAERIHPNDPQRIQRALEVYEISGKSLSELWQQQASQELPYRLAKIAYFPQDRERLRQRIAQRFQQMLKQGFIDEVEALKARGDLSLDMPSMRCVGYRQVWEYIEGVLSHDEMVEKAITATRQLAKRQLTWLRKEQNCNFYDIDVSTAQKIMKNLKNSLFFN
jgi:tRNA dimethylallyltransferase